MDLPHTELRVSGNIRDMDGDPVSDAIVSIDGGPSTSTHDDGTFELTVARSRFRSGIAVVVSHPLYVTARQSRTVDLTSPFTFALQEPPPNYHVVQGIDFLAVGHWLGKTWIRAGIVLENTNPRSLYVTEIVARAISPIGESYQVPRFLFDAAVPPIAQNTSIKLRTNKIQRLDTEFHEPLARPDLIEAVNKAFMANGMQISSSDKKPLFPPGLTAQLQDVARSGLIWTTGPWKVEVCALLEMTKDCRMWSFEITDQQEKALGGVIARYASGIGVLNAYRFSDRPEDRGFIEVAARPEQQASP
jgi:hypothetical protein